MSEWAVRTMGSAEVAAVASLVVRAYSTLYDDATIAGELDLSEDFGSSSGTTLVVGDLRRREVIVGCVTMHYPFRLEGGRSGPPQSASIARLAVDPDYRGRGIADALVAAAEAMALDAGATSLVLQTDEDMVAARRLYSRRGYVPLASLNFDIGPELRSFGLQLVLVDGGPRR